ncbi:MAG: hypothetical protein PW843_13940 [Azospirillaceae bacterium]|nr:hypothetical protein [Azospirillaceae bacterium]
MTTPPVTMPTTPPLLPRRRQGGGERHQYLDDHGQQAHRHQAREQHRAGWRAGDHHQRDRRYQSLPHHQPPPVHQVTQGHDEDQAQGIAHLSPGDDRADMGRQQRQITRHGIQQGMGDVDVRDAQPTGGGDGQDNPRRQSFRLHRPFQHRHRPLPSRIWFYNGTYCVVGRPVLF